MKELEALEIETVLSEPAVQEAEEVIEEALGIVLRVTVSEAVLVPTQLPSVNSIAREALKVTVAFPAES